MTLADLRRFDRVARVAVALLLSTAASGCAALGAIAYAMPTPPVPAKVSLAGQSVGVMVWCDRGLRVDWPSIQADLAGGVQTRLLEAQKAEAKDLKDATFPFPAESYVRWQREHPGFENQQIPVIAAQLPVTRLIYIEINDLNTRSTRAMALYRGSASASIKVVEVKDGVGKIIYEEPNISVVYPKHSTEDGRPEGNDIRMYAGTMTELADQIATRFVEHRAEDE